LKLYSKGGIILELFIAAALILMVALMFSPLGLGGGVLYLPILHYLAEWSLIDSFLGSLAMVLSVEIGSSFAHSREGHADNKIANIGRITAVPAAIVGTIISWLAIEYVSDLVIKIFASAILIFVIERTLRTPKEVENVDEKLGLYRVGTAFGGFSSGMLGMGGGSIFVTLNRSLMGMDMRKSAGTSYLIGATVVPVALISHILIDGSFPSVYENVGLITVILMPLLGLCASFFGAKFAIKSLPINVITVAFIIAVSLSLTRYLWDIFSRII